MLYFLKIYFKTRKAWLLLIFFSCILEAIALFFQHFMLIKPCVLCIYQRCALYGIIISGIISIICPKKFLLRFIGIIFWLYNSNKGFLLAKKHTEIIFSPSPFTKCDLFVNFPHWLPLNKWLPEIFHAYGNCSEHQWFFLSLEMSQWIMIIFGTYLIIAIFVLLAQFSKKPN